MSINPIPDDDDSGAPVDFGAFPPIDDDEPLGVVRGGSGTGQDTGTGSTGTSAFASDTITHAGSGLVFVNTYGSGVSTAFHNEIVAAETYLETHFINSTTIYANFDLQTLNPAFSGENSFNTVGVSYATLVSALASHATSADDKAAVAKLQGMADPSGGQLYQVSYGEAVVLGLAAPNSNMNDSVILNSTYWTASALQNNPTDAEAVLEHELTEGGMGRIGGQWAPMDLFRYTATGQLDDTGGQDGKLTYFSPNGSNIYTGLQNHNPINSSGQDDGQDWADWDQVSQDAAAHDPFGPGGPGAGDPGTLSQTDIRIMDVLGWKVQVRPTDFNGDGGSDLVWRNGTTGAFSITNMAGSQTATNAYSNVNVPTDWKLAGTMDFNGDGLADLVWSNSSTGQFTVWDAKFGVGNVNTFATDSFAPNVYVASVAAGWNLNAVGDFNGDGKGDLIWQNGTTFTEWQSTGSGFTPNVTVSSVSAGWNLQGIGDFNGDGKDDLLWANNGTFTIWDSTGNGFTPNNYVGSVSPGWSLAGVGDFNSDGKDDLVWSNGSGVFSVWTGTGTGFNANTFVGSTGAGWSLAGIGDYMGAGFDDMMFTNASTGGYSVWASNGAGSFTPNAATGTAPTGTTLASNPTQHIVG